MQSMRISIFLVLFLLILINPSSVTAATERRIALVIGNGAYSSGPLKNPVNDATDMAAALQMLGFKVNLKKNANLETMEGAIEDFGNQLKKGGVGLFYYAGHGVQVNGVNYLIPIGAKINKESDVRYKAVDAGRILDEMGNANNGMNIVLLDACRDNPFGKSFRSASRGLAIVSNSPSGTFISYSTSPGQVARDGEARNSPYTAALLKHIGEPGLTINDVFMNVRSKVKKQTGQVPWELSSLEGKFYFNQGKVAKIVGQETGTTNKEELKEDASANLENERLKIEAEKEKLRLEKELLEQKKALAEEKRKLEEERQKLAYVPKIDPTKGTRFIDFINATVTQVKFFEGPYDSPARDLRSYRTSFSRTSTRFVHWELDLQYPPPGVRKNFFIEHIWYNPYGKEFGRGTLNNQYVLADWGNSYHVHSFGWKDAASSGWIAGTYRVDLYVNGVKIASENFDIY